MLLAIIITTYNRPDALAVVIEGFLAQSDLCFELIVADDGSQPSTKQVVDDYAHQAPFKIHHVWHEDKGFRAAAIRNKAIMSTNADYIIFTDGDCIPRFDFVFQHKRLAEKGWFVSGSRVLLTEDLTESVIKLRHEIHQWTISNWLSYWRNKQINRISPILRVPILRKLSPYKWQGAKTCNLAIWRQDLIAVNGLDESYSGWGMEDSDLVIRLLHAGIKHKNGRFSTTVFHLWHKENDRSMLDTNVQKLKNLLFSNYTEAKLGLTQYDGNS